MTEVNRGRVLATRPAPKNDQLCHDLAAAGWEPVALPLLAIHAFADTPSPEAQAIRNLILELDRYTVVIAISPTAARLGADWIDNYWPQLPLGIHWFGIGQSSASALATMGIQVESPEAGITSEDLLAHPALNGETIVGQRVLILRGEGGRATLGQTLAARGAEVDYCQLYRRECPQYPPAEIDKEVYAQPLSGILVTSGEALDNLLALAPELPTRQHAPVIVPSARIAEHAHASGLTNVRVASGADNRSMIETLNAADRQEARHERKQHQDT